MKYVYYNTWMLECCTAKVLPNYYFVGFIALEVWSKMGDPQRPKVPPQESPIQQSAKVRKTMVSFGRQWVAWCGLSWPSCRKCSQVKFWGHAWTPSLPLDVGICQMWNAAKFPASVVTSCVSLETYQKSMIRITKLFSLFKSVKMILALNPNPIGGGGGLYGPPVIFFAVHLAWLEFRVQTSWLFSLKSPAYFDI